MKVARADIKSVVTSTCQHLQVLKRKISEEVSNVNEEELKALIDALQHEVNHLAREVNQSQSLVPLDPKLKTDLRALMFSIQHTPAFSQAVGAHQEQLLNAFRKIETSLARVEQKTC